MKIGFGIKHGSLAPDYIVYADIWKLLCANLPSPSKPKFGDGTYDNPYVPLGVGNWYWLSQQGVAKEPTFIKVADRLIAKWGSAQGGLKNYTSDVTGFPRELFEAESKEAIGKAKKDAEEEDKRRKSNPEHSVYTRKALRVKKVTAQAPTIARQMLWGHGTQDEDAIELANTITGLLVSEGGADRDYSKGTVFVCTMMLLDLTEKKIAYGANGQHYTWESMHVACRQQRPRATQYRWPQGEGSQ